MAGAGEGRWKMRHTFEARGVMVMSMSLPFSSFRGLAITVVEKGRRGFWRVVGIVEGETKSWEKGVVAGEEEGMRMGMGRCLS